MKKFFALLLVVLMLLPSIVACGETETPPEESSKVESSKSDKNPAKPDDGEDSSKVDTNNSSDVPSSSEKDDGNTTDSSDKPASSTTNSSNGDNSNIGSSDNGSTGDTQSSTAGSTDNSGTVPSTGTSTGTSSSTKPVTPPSTGDKDENPPAVNTKWSGETLNILATIWTGDAPSAPWSQVELTVGPDDWNSTAGFGNIINMAVLQRAEEIRETYGVELNWINSRGSQIATLISEAIVGGSESTKYHIAMPRMLEAQTIVATNGIYNLAGRRYIDLTKSYYNQVSVESYTISNNTLFVAGDFSFLDEQTSYLMYYNVAMTNGLAIPDLYTMVKQGKWTIDELTNISMLVKKNEGDPKWTDEDTYGFGTTNMSRFFQYSGIKQVSTQATQYGNKYVVSLDDPKVGTLIEKILQINSSDWARTRWDGDYGALQAAFTEGRLLFYNEVIQKIDYFKNQTDEFRVGILPCPKLSTDQESYYTPCSYQSVVMCIPKATPDREMSEYFFEILSYTGQKYIMKAFKENMRTNLDAESAATSMEIIENYIFPNLCYDQGYMYGWNGLLSDVQGNSYSAGKNNFTQEYSAAAEQALATVANWNLAWEDYTDAID